MTMEIPTPACALVRNDTFLICSLLYERDYRASAENDHLSDVSWPRLNRYSFFL